MHQCPECKYENENIGSLARHYGRAHKERQKKELYVALFCNGIAPTCACACGESTKYLGIGKGFRKYRRGHMARIKNNWGHNAGALKKSQEKRRQMFKDGELDVWNRGLTKEVDERVAENGRRSADTILANPEELRRRSERMKKNRLDGTVPTLRGSDHSQWKGGVSRVSDRCHGSHRLYKEWKHPLLRSANFTCQRCSSAESLEVHHDMVTMAELIHKHTKIINPELLDSFELQTKVVEAVVSEHIENKISGEVICHQCHKEEHPSYNYRT